MNIKKIPVSFEGIGEVSNYLFEKIKESETAYIYKLTAKENDFYDVLEKEHYEVFKKKISAQLINFEKRIYSTENFREIYPKSKHFGIWAWVYFDFKKALEKFNSL